MRNGRGNTTIRDRHRKIILREETHCAWCHEEVDKTLPYLHPKSAVVDHRIPISRSGSDDLSNKQLMHRDCNREKGDRLPGEQPNVKRKATHVDNTGLPDHQLPAGVSFMTRRKWW